MLLGFFFDDTATTEIYTLSLHELFRSVPSGVPSVRHSLCCVPNTATPSTKPTTGPAGAYSTAGVTGARRTVPSAVPSVFQSRSEEHTSELQSRLHLVCRLLLEKKNRRT